MAGEIQIAHNETGVNLYAIIRNTNSLVWDGAEFETYASLSLGDYDIALTEQGASRFYIGNMPSLSYGIYHISIYKRAGGSPAEGDTLVGTEVKHWNGSEVMNLASVVQILNQDITETVAGNLAESFETFFDVADSTTQVSDIGNVTQIAGYEVADYTGSNFNDFFDVFPMETTDVNDIRDIKIITQSRGR